MLKSAAIPFFLILLGYVVIADENFTVILSGIAIFIIGMFFMQDGFQTAIWWYFRETFRKVY